MTKILSPLSLLSCLTGWFAALRHPRFLVHLAIWIYAKWYKVDLSESAKTLREFESTDDFFTRALKPGVRPIGEGAISPVDGTLRDCGLVTQSRLTQIKGKTYSIVELLDDGSDAARFEGGVYFNFYLSPPDYHRIHMPVSGNIIRSSYLPGTLWPVNDWALNNITPLFARNERVVSYIEGDAGLVALVMVGAFNVGKISVSYDSFLTNALFSSGTIHKTYASPKGITKGGELGKFHLGSAVILIFEAGRIKLPAQADFPRTVKVGQSLN